MSEARPERDPSAAPDAGRSRQPRQINPRAVITGVLFITIIGLAIWYLARAVGDHDLNTFLIRANPVANGAGLQPGMTVWLSRQQQLRGGRRCRHQAGRQPPRLAMIATETRSTTTGSRR